MDPKNPKPPQDVPLFKDARAAFGASLLRARTKDEKPRAVGAMMVRVVLIYITVATAWILVSDRLVRVFVSDTDLQATVSTFKGWAFVLVTGGLLYMLLRREVCYWVKERTARNEAEAALRLQNKRQQMLLEASRLASETTGSEHELSVALMNLVGPHSEVDVCFHYRLENDGTHLDLIAGIGLPSRHSQLIQRPAMESSFVGLVATMGKTLVVDHHRMSTDERGAQGRLIGLKAYVACPLMTRDGRVLGTLSFGSFKREAFSNEEVEMLQIVSRFASLATERLRTMAALRESESRLRQMTDSLPQMVWTCDASGSCDYLSQNWVDYTGIAAAEQLGNGWVGRIHPDDRLRLMEQWSHAVATGNAVQTEFRLRGKDGGYRWFDTRALPVRDSDGRILKWFGSNTDVTERMQAETALREIEEHQRLFIEHAPAALAMFDREMHYMAVSRRWLSDYGLLQGRELLGISHYAVFPEITQRWKDIHRRALSGEVITAEADPFERTDGTVQWLRWEVRPWRNAQEAIGGIVVFSEDITAKVRAENALRESEARYRLLAENTADVIWVLDMATRRFTYVSPSVEKLRGYPPEEVLQQTMEQALTPASFAMIAKTLPVRLSDFAAGDPTAITQIHEIEQWRKDGSAVWTEVVTTLVKNSGGELQMVGVSRDIAARRKMEAALHASEAQSRSVVESAPDAIFIQTGGNFAYLNPAAVRLFGAATADQLVGKPVLDSIHPDFKEKTRLRIRQLNENRESATLTTQRFVRLDGTFIDVETTGVPFVHKGESGALVFARDVTERKRTEEQMHFQQAILEETGQIAKVGGWFFDPASGEGYWTDEVARIHDLPTNVQTEMKTGLHYYQGESRRKIEEAIKRAVEQGTSYDLELELTTAKGNRKWVRTIGHPLMENGKVVRVRGSFQDITQRKLGEQALRESEARFRQVVENIEEVFWVTDHEKKAILYLSPAYEKIWGRSVTSAIESPQSWLEAVHEDDRGRVRDAASTKQTTGEYAEVYRIRRPDGTIRWIQDRAFPVRDAEGKVYRVVGTAADITERRKLEAQFRQAQKMEAIGTLAGGIAHDFNNILGAISGFAELARLDPTRVTMDTSLDEILKASKRASDLVRQILAFSRQQEQKRLPIQLWRVIDEAIRLLRAALPSTIKFEVELAKEAPAVLADATQIHQVVMNLCTNAAHAMEGRSGLLQVKLKPFLMDEAFARTHPGANSGPYALLEIKDNGHGMDQATLERIFEPFFTTKAPGEGTGLGLSVVHGIVQTHEGVITVYSRPGEGTVFHLYFPAHHQGEAITEVPNEALPRGNRERILVVDDEPQLVRMMGSMLGKLGYQVETSTQPVLALQKATATHTAYDLVLTDLTMPEMTGAEFVAHVLLASPTTKVILMTGFMTKQNQEQVARLGVQEVLFKPISLSTLAETIHRVLKK